jgi:hypothetical protein
VPKQKVVVVGARELDREFDRQLKKCDGVKRVINEMAIAIQTQAQDNVRALGAVDNGQLRQSITVDTVSRGFGAEIGPEEPYGLYIELGTRKHFPPVQPLEEWAHRHGMDGAGYAIAKKISKRGTQARPFLLPAFFSHEGEIEKRLAEEMER